MIERGTPSWNAAILFLILLICGPAWARSDRGTDAFQSQTLAVEAPVLKSFIQDLDRDGLLDFAFHAEDRRFVLFFQEGDGSFRRAEATFLIPPGTDSLDLADVDGDEVPDICLTVEGRTLQVIHSAGNPDFWKEQAAAGVVDQTVALDIDLLAGETNSAVPGPLTDSLHRSPDLMWDLDGDGRQDFLYPRFQGMEIRFNPAGDSDAPFAAARRQFIPRGPRVSLRGSRIVVRRELPLAMDLYQDGRSEVVFEPRPVHGLGQLECGWCRYDKSEGILKWVGQELQFGVGESVTEYLLDDFNDDGEPDLAVLSTGFNMDDPGGGDGSVSAGSGGSFFEEKKLRLWLSTGTGSAMGRKPAGEWISEINIWQDAVLRHRDLTGDGKDDLCIFYFKGLIKAKLMIDIHPGLGGGRYGPRIKGQKMGFDSADRGTILLDTDMDGDGLGDLVLLAEDRVRVHLRNPAGDSDGEPFSEKPWAVLDKRPEAEDGEDDGETVTLSLGSTGSDISFSSNQLDGLRIIDLNSDGHPDLVLVSRPDNWLQKGLGQPPVTLLLHIARPQ